MRIFFIPDYSVLLKIFLANISDISGSSNRNIFFKTEFLTEAPYSFLCKNLGSFF